MSFLSDDGRCQFLAEFAYNGADFFGVQEQKNLKTVLGTLRQRIELVYPNPVRCLFVAARTDRGVHALHNCATFYVHHPVDTKALIRGVETFRDDGLYAVRIRQVDKKVHARAGVGKIYRYTIIDGCEQPEQSSDGFAWSLTPTLDLEKMREAAAYLVGEQDFSSLRGGGCQAGTTVKHMYAITIARINKNLVTIEISGQSFLRRMIRNMVGLLVEIGAGLRDPLCVPAILAEKNRLAAGIMAPAQGLLLMRVLLNHGLD